MIYEYIDKGEIYTSFPAETMEAKKKIYNATNTKCVSLSDMDGKEIEISDVIVTPAIINSDGEETKNVTRCVLVGTDGKYYGGTGSALLQNIDNAIEIFGTPSKENPFKFAVTKIQSSKNAMYKYVTLEII